eukprot:71457-Hanusia_phi.AAC.2
MTCSLADGSGQGGDTSQKSSAWHIAVIVIIIFVADAASSQSLLQLFAAFGWAAKDQGWVQFWAKGGVNSCGPQRPETKLWFTNITASPLPLAVDLGGPCSYFWTDMAEEERTMALEEMRRRSFTTWYGCERKA